jgi:hypothetical protein
MRGRQPLGFQFHGKELADAIDRVIGDAGENVSQISLGVAAIHFGGLEEGTCQISRRSGARVDQ